MADLAAVTHQLFLVVAQLTSLALLFAAIACLLALLADLAHFFTSGLDANIGAIMNEPLGTFDAPHGDGHRAHANPCAIVVRRAVPDAAVVTPVKAIAVKY